MNNYKSGAYRQYQKKFKIKCVFYITVTDMHLFHLAIQKKVY